ncbi:MAG: glycoside hydrolase family 2 TIM barrel-domain containing protein [Candidatus Omnitrophota bacterium]|nr:glycoside hydrolase family 2 TIM barrel-domain containing protein [Candidatus Omnitrophota bacterium]
MRDAHRSPLTAHLVWGVIGIVGWLLLAPGGWAAGRVDSVDRETASRPSPPPAGARHRVQVRGDWFYVDGEPFLVKGVGYSPSRPGQLPWRDRVDPALMERDFQRIVQAGFNTLRTWSPLSPEALSLADRYGLMVLQGIWVEHNGNYASEAFRTRTLKTISAEVRRTQPHANVLAFLVGNELLPEQVFQSGIGEIETLLSQMAQEVKRADATRLASYANWPSLSFLDASIWDLVCFNLYPYEPSSVAHTFGFRGYVEHLKRTAARGKPLVITEVGLSVSPVAAPKAGYGGFTPEAQRRELVTLWDDLFQAGAQGGVIFEWNDEWWKQYESADDALTHERTDPEEWFGLVEFPSAEETEGRARPALEALAAYNQAVLLSPVSGEPYHGRIPVTVYATEAVRQVRVRVDEGRWHAATKLNRHWWKVLLPLDAQTVVGEHRLLMEASDAKRRLLATRERAIRLGPPLSVPRVSIETDRSLYDVGEALEPVRYTIAVTDAAGQPLPNQPVYWSITEPQAKSDLTQAKVTDGQGRLEGSYLVHEPGLIIFAAATPLGGVSQERRVGAETFVAIRQLPSLGHQPSPWEAGLPEELIRALRHEPPAFQLADAGRERIVDYERYGAFLNVGTPTYRYEVTDWEGLAAAVGEGIYPNAAGLLKDPAYRAAKQAGRLDGNHWDFTFLDDPQLSFLKWADTEEEPGVKQFYTALTLERAGLWLHAVKAYDAVLVHFPTSVGWTAFDPPTPWYVGKVARDKIEAILRLHPELGMRLEGAQIVIDHGFDNDVDNDTILVTPGRLVPTAPTEVNPSSVDVSTLAVTREVGKGRVRLLRSENGHWRLTVDGKPWTIRGLTYQPSQVGESPDEGTLRDWMTTDRNRNQQLDVFETFVDGNGNNQQDAEEPMVGDFRLLQEMGVNTIRLYHHASDPALLRRLHHDHGLMVLMGDLVGMYTVGSGASWEAGTDYLDPKQRKRMFEGVKQMVREFKDEPYILMWVLGNENNYGGVHGIVGGVGNAGRYPEAYYGFLNELAQWIHKEDPHHPVAVANGDLGFLDLIARAAPDVDVFGANVYRGWHGFGRSLFEEVRRHLDKPVLITEYGCPAYQMGRSRELAERDQALYHFGNWVDILDNRAGRGVGNALGGVAFEWSDEWWKGGQPPRFSPSAQETQPNWAGPFPGGWNFEEWFGLVSQGEGRMSPFLRQLRLSYRLYQALWSRSSQ